MKSERVIILGAGGHGRVVAEVLRQMGWTSNLFLDDDPKRLESLIEGRRIMGPITQPVLAILASEGIANFTVGIGSVNAEGCALRGKLYKMALGAGLRAVTAVSSTAVVLGHLETGVFVGPGAIVMPGALVAANSIINTGAIVEHDCRVGWSSHVAPGAVLAGGVVLGELVHVGAGAVVKQGLTIGKGATIGMGAVVLADVGPGVTVVGNPARVLAQ